jgi:predicted nucleic acid-binding protein
VASVVLDADVLIGFLDPADAQHERAVRLTRPWLTGEHELHVGAGAYAEILIRPLRGHTDARVDAFLDAANIQIVTVDRALARSAAELRARHQSLRLPDALSLATALGLSAELATFDRRLQRIARSASAA